MFVNSKTEVNRDNFIQKKENVSCIGQLQMCQSTIKKSVDWSSHKVTNMTSCQPNL